MPVEYNVNTNFQQEKMLLTQELASQDRAAQSLVDDSELDSLDRVELIRRHGTVDIAVSITDECDDMFWSLVQCSCVKDLVQKPSGYVTTVRGYRSYRMKS